MKTLILPDIHCHFDFAEVIIDKEKPNRTIFLGDYFDRFDTDPTLTHQTAEWLKSSVEKPHRIHLLGNHELFYVSGNSLMLCSGNTELKYKVIRNADIPWSKFNLHYWLDDWLITHAGLSYDYYQEYSNGLSPGNFIRHESKTAKDELLSGRYHRLFSVSWMRGGNSDFAGTLWCDINEFKPIKGLKQIFGHSHLPRAWEKYTNNWCVDADGCYVIYEDGQLMIKP